MASLTKNHVARNKAFVFLTISSTLIYLAWRLFYTIPFGLGFVSMTFGIALLFFESMGLVESIIHYFNMFNILEPVLPEIPEHTYPDVDIYIATYREPMDLLYKTINGCKKIKYPGKGKVHVHLCDDGRRPEAEKLANSMGINYINRPDNKGAKAGNLNNAMSKTSAPLMLILDADMIPKHDILLRMVPFFVDEEIKNENRPKEEQVHIGFVQSPQAFYNPDLFQYFLFSENRIPNEQDYFYRDIQISRNATNSPIFGGSNALISRKAINDIGGFFTESITEDFATGCLIQRAGYRCYAIADVLASGLSPTDIPSLIQQRIRWARGCISTGKQLHLLTGKGLTIRQRLNYFASVWYWYSSLKRLVYVMGPLLFLLFGFVPIKCTLTEILSFWLPMYVLNSVTLNMLSRNIRNVKWTGVYETVMFPFMIIPVILESIGISLKKFKVTSKEKPGSDTSQNIIYAVPFVLLVFLSLFALFRGFFMFLDIGVLSPLVTLFWLCSNLFSLIMALIFMLGRRIFRSSERVQAELPCILHLENHAPLHCETIDFSENGVSVFMDFPLEIDKDESVDIEFITERYYAKVKTRIVLVGMSGRGWKFSFFIEDYYNTYDDFLGVLYDREPTLPARLSKTQSIFEDIKINVTSRKKISYFQNRQYPRIPMNEIVLNNGGVAINIIDYNYHYTLIQHKDPPRNMILKPMEDLDINLSLIRRSKNELALYSVQNYDEIHNDTVKRLFLDWWLQYAHENARTDNAVISNYEETLVREFLGFMPGRDKATTETEIDNPDRIGDNAFPWRLVFMPGMAILAFLTVNFFSALSFSGTYEIDEELPVFEQSVRDMIFPANLVHYLAPESALTIAVNEISPVNVSDEIEVPKLMVFVITNKDISFMRNSDEWSNDDEVIKKLTTLTQEVAELPHSQIIRMDGHTSRMNYYYGELELSYSRVNKIVRAMIGLDLGLNRPSLPYEERCGWGSFVNASIQNSDMHIRQIIATPVINLPQDELPFLPGMTEISISRQAKKQLDKTAKLLLALIRNNPGQAFKIEGPVERTGNQEEELQLSMNRARTIARELIIRGVPASLLYTVGRSTGIPFCGSASLEGHGAAILPIAKTEETLLP